MTTKRILIIDDEECMCKDILPGLLQLILGTVVVDGALTVREGLELFARHTYDLIFVDRRIASDDGIDLIADLRRRGFTGKIIFITASGDDVLREGIEAGANISARKPFDRVLLKRALVQVQFLPT